MVPVIELGWLEDSAILGGCGSPSAPHQHAVNRRQRHTVRSNGFENRGLEVVRSILCFVPWGAKSLLVKWFIRWDQKAMCNESQALTFLK